MSIPKRLSIRFHAEATPGFDITQAVPVFHRWIREHAVDNELLLDVADYKHVVDGPGVLLIGHEADYGLEVVDGKLSLLYTRKRDVGQSLTGAFKTLFDQSIRAARKLETEPELDGLRVHTGSADVAILDRLHYENSDDGVNAIGASLEDVLADVYDDAAILRRIDNDPREPLTLRVGQGSPAHQN